ncbi:hypothetical protein BDF14DRAFT_1827525 [Spinellus fusiger]|nr:hypothetical protein BDF14DRAFT_1827525 [Spinellus fusiger]
MICFLFLSLMLQILVYILHKSISMNNQTIIMSRLHRIDEAKLLSIQPLYGASVSCQVHLFIMPLFYICLCKIS